MKKNKSIRWYLIKINNSIDFNDEGDFSNRVYIGNRNGYYSWYECWKIYIIMLKSNSEGGCSYMIMNLKMLWEYKRELMRLNKSRFEDS